MILRFVAGHGRDFLGQVDRKRRVGDLFLQLQRLTLEAAPGLPGDVLSMEGLYVSLPNSQCCVLRINFCQREVLGDPLTGLSLILNIHDRVAWRAA